MTAAYADAQTKYAAGSGCFGDGGPGGKRPGGRIFTMSHRVNQE